MTESRVLLRGVLHYFLESGYEGDGWAFQDERFITENTTRFHCRKCGLPWDKDRHPNDPYVPTGGRYCPPGAHDFQLISKENWSYEGLHFLDDGDELTIYDKADPSKVVWSGTIKRRVLNAAAPWRDVTQEGVGQDDWERWLVKEYPATLLPASRQS